MNLESLKDTATNLRAWRWKIDKTLAAIDELLGVETIVKEVMEPVVQVTVCPPEAVKKVARSMRKRKPPKQSGSQDAKTRTEKACHKCGKTKILAEYPTNAQCRDGHTGECKVCARARHAAHWRDLIASRDGKYPCPHCPKVFSNAVMFEQHKRISHPEAA